MTTKTRYFVIVSLLTLGVGLGTGVVAYYVGFPAGAFASHGGPVELGFVPRDASVIAFANVHEIMTSELRQKMRRAIPIQENGQQELENQTGINLETDIDTVVACMSPEAVGATTPGAGMVLARGRFDETKIEALMREHGRSGNRQRQAAHRRGPQGPPARQTRRLFDPDPSSPYDQPLPFIHGTRPRGDRQHAADQGRHRSAQGRQQPPGGA